MQNFIKIDFLILILWYIITYELNFKITNVIKIDMNHLQTYKNIAFINIKRRDITILFYTKKKVNEKF